MSAANNAQNAVAAEPPKAELKFHPDFAQNLARLANLSSFFAGLPPPSTADLVDGAALIPLPDTSSAAILIALRAVQSITMVDVFRLLPLDEDLGQIIGPPIIIDTAVLASRFDLPIITRILMEGVGSHPALRKTPFLEFTVWAISGIYPKIVEAGEATVNDNITTIAKPIAAALRLHAPACWTQIQDLHLRRAAGSTRFNQQARPRTDGACYNCIASGDVDREVEVLRRFRACHTVEEINKLVDNEYGLECGECAIVFEEDYEPKMAWFTDFTSRYVFDKTYEDYVDGQP